MKKILTTLHRWLGFPVGILFVVMFGSGCLTAIDELLERYEQAQYNSNYSFKQISSAEKAAVISTITEGKKGVRSIVLPTEETPYFRVASRKESWTYAIDDPSQVVHKENEEAFFFRTVLQLHRNFLLGKEGFLGVEGKYYAVWVGLIALILSLLGLWIWWPLRKSFKVKDVVPQGKKRKHYYYSHMTSGVITLVAVIVLSLTGATITYRQIAQQIFNVNNKQQTPLKPLSLENNWQAWINAAYAQMPEGSQLTQIRYPRPPRGGNPKNTERNSNQPEIYSFRFVSPDSWFGLAQSSVKIDKKSSTLIETSRFETLSFSQKIYTILVPLHTGHNLPVFYVILLFAFGLIGTIMVLSGLLSFVLKKRKWPKVSRLSPVTSIAK